MKIIRKLVLNLDRPTNVEEVLEKANFPYYDVVRINGSRYSVTLWSDSFDEEGRKIELLRELVGHSYMVTQTTQFVAS